jgi:hypothetical protein
MGPRVLSPRALACALQLHETELYLEQPDKLKDVSIAALSRCAWTAQERARPRLRPNQRAPGG